MLRRCHFVVAGYVVMPIRVAVAVLFVIAALSQWIIIVDRHSRRTMAVVRVSRVRGEGHTTVSCTAQFLFYSVSVPFAACY